MRFAIIIAIAIAFFGSGALLSTGAKYGQGKEAYDVHFPTITVPPNAGISLVRIVISCGHVAAVNRIPDDWYVQTLFPPHETEPEWQEFKFTSNAIDFEAGHGVSRLRDLKSLDGGVTVTVDDARCFDIVADIKDDTEEDTAWKVRLRKPQLVLRTHHSATAPPNKSLHASRASELLIESLRVSRLRAAA